MRAKFLLAALFAFYAAPVLAQQSTPSPLVKAELLLDAADLQSGDVAWAAVRYTIPEQWHIYWKNPGDSGIPTTMKWTTPEGITAGDIQWPAPQRQPLGDMVNYGYSHEVVLPVPLNISADAVGGPITVKTDWLVCHDICIPESATLTATLPVGGDAGAIEAARELAPLDFPGKASYAANDTEVQLTLIPNSAWDAPERAEFMPEEDGIMKNSTLPKLDNAEGTIVLTLPRSSAELPNVWNGVVWLHWDGKEPIAYQIAAELGMAPLTAPVVPLPLIIILGLAFVGGLLLNIMPCVLPILSLKALALVKKADAAPHAARMQGVAYTVGVVLSFVLIAATMLALKASGEAVGWGFHLQSPATVAILAVLMTLVSLNMLGVFHLPPVLGHFMVAHEGVRGTFLTGVLAVAVATPCTAPFMATAVGATLALPALTSLLVFSTMGLGMASPFLLISQWPAARRLLPKPGHWMHRFRQILALPMVLTALWLFYVLSQLLFPTPMQHDAGYSIITPIPYSEEKLAELREQQQPVFVDATAAWCLTCKVNERVALKPEKVQRAFKKQGVTLMVADWTARDEAIARYLATFGRNGVPIYVYYPPGQSPIVLPQVLSPSVVLDTLNGNMTNR